MNSAMEALMDDSSTKQTDNQDASQAQQNRLHRDLGPNLKTPSRRKRVKSIISFALKNYLTQIIVMTSALLLLGFGILKWDVLLLPIYFQNTTTMSSATPSNWADWWMRVQSFLGMGTLIVALFVWYSRIRDDWENHLPKRMSVFFFHIGKPVIICRYVWLSSADDLRAWGQQVATQAAYNDRNLEFSPEIKTGDPSLIVMTKDYTICKHYTICFQLKKIPSSLTKESGMCRYQNFASEDNRVHPIPSEIVATLSEVEDWQMGAGSDCVNPVKYEK
jgi:hypothetical protein